MPACLAARPPACPPAKYPQLLVLTLCCRPDLEDDVASEAASQLSRLSIYTDATHTSAGSTLPFSSTAASTLGGKKKKSGRPRKVGLV